VNIRKVIKFGVAGLPSFLVAIPLNYLLVTRWHMAKPAAYALVLAHIGEVAMAVTSSLTIHFLRGAKPGDLYAEGTLLKLGRRIATVDVLIWSESRERAAARATVAYAIP